MDKKAKIEALIFTPNVLFYLLLNYLPIASWIGEVGSLAFKLVAYILMTVDLIFLKSYFHLELPKPVKQLPLLALLPLTIIWFVHPLYALLFGGNLILEDLNTGILILEIFVDLFLAVVEDVLFVEIALSLFHHLFYKTNRKGMLSIGLAAAFFVVCHAYTFIGNSYSKAIPIEIANYYLIIECAYLATYFQDSWLPVLFHLMFNEMNIVVFDRIFEIEYGWRYDLFIVIIFILTCYYLAAVYQLSRITQTMTIADIKENHGSKRLNSKVFFKNRYLPKAKKAIFIATNNKGKIREFIDMLSPLGYTIFSPKDLFVSIDVKENGLTYQENSIIKAKDYAAIVRMPVIADDSGFEVDGLDNFPGVISARFASSVGRNYDDACQKLNRMLGDNPNRHARFVCCITYLENKNAQPVCFQESVEGSLLKERKGGNGFGYDPYFHYDEGNMDFGLISEEEKNKVSHRGKALADILDYLSKKNEAK